MHCISLGLLVTGHTFSFLLEHMCEVVKFLQSDERDITYHQHRIYLEAEMSYTCMLQRYKKMLLNKLFLLIYFVGETQYHPPSPMLLLVTSDGLLLCYYMMLSVPNTPSLNVQAELLQGTERPSMCYTWLLYVLVVSLM